MTEQHIQSVTDRVRKAVSDTLKQELHPGNDAVELRELFPSQYDSVAVLDVVGGVESEFEILVDLVNDDLRNTFASIESISGLIARKLHDRAVLGEGF